MNPITRAKVAGILAETITKEPTNWTDIMAAISAQVTIRNWMSVRGILQGMMDDGVIKRTPDVHNEDYVLIP